MRSKTLDILRAVAVLLVIGRHLQPCPPELNAALSGFTTHWRMGGWIGVDLFFVLSGFLVSGLLFKERQRYGTLSPKNFLLRRGLKIYPAFYAMLAATVAVRLVTGKGVPLAGLLREIFFVQNYGPGLQGHTWSLAVEEHFYLLLLLVLFVGMRRERSDSGARPFAWLPRFFVTVALLCLGLRLYVHFTTPYFTNHTHQFPTHLRIDSLLFGVLLSYFYHYHAGVWRVWTARYRGAWAILGVALLLPPFFVPVEQSNWLSNIGFTMLYMGSGLLLCALADVTPPDNWLVRGVAFVGARSYSVYLWHVAVMTWLGNGLRGRVGWYAYALVSVLGALAVGIVAAQLLEVPVLRLRDRIFPSRSQPVAITNEASSAKI